MAPFQFSDFINRFAQMDGFTLILPFVLIFIISHKALEEFAPIFSDDGNERIAALTALVMALLSTSFLVRNPVYQPYFQQYIGLIAIGLIGILGFAMVLGFTGIELGEKGTPLLVLLAIMTSLSAFVLSEGVFAFLPSKEVIYGMSFADIYSYAFQTGLIYFIIIGGFIYWAYAPTVDPNGDNDEDQSRALQALDNILGGE